MSDQFELRLPVSLRRRAAQDQIETLLVATIEPVKENRAALAKQRKLLWIELCVSRGDVVLRGPLVWTREDRLLFHYEAERVVVDCADQDDGLANGEATFD